jgi:ribosome-associated protein
VPADLEVQRGLVIPGDELHQTASRAGGPGGQHVNKTSTRVSLRWNVAESGALTNAQRARLRRRLASRLTRDGALVVHARTTRSQAQNRRLARERLAETIREALVVPKRRRSTRPTRASRERRLEGKRHRSSVKRGRGRVRGED